MTNLGTPRELRFGILCNSLELETWQISCLEALLAVKGCMPVVVVLNSTTQVPNPLLRRLVNLLRTGRFTWAVFDRLVASRPSPVTRSCPPPGWLRDLPTLECAVSKKGSYSEYFSDEDLEQLRALNLDFLIKFGFGVTRGAILDVARYGVWSFHHDDETRYRGAPPCFWEIYLVHPRLHGHI
jgi:methionyl-tRNA formyltransferase